MEPKTVRVRIAVVVNNKGEWESSGWFYGKAVSDECKADIARDSLDSQELHGIEQTYFIEADLPVPEAKTVEGRIA